MWTRLLVPHDFSECGRCALDVALELAERNGGALTLFHVSPLPPNLPAEARVTPPGASSAVSVAELVTAGARQELEAIAAPLRARGLSVATRAIASSARDPSAEILQAADELRADVIVLGTHGRDGLAHLFLGSVAEKVIRGARVPVVSVRFAGPEPTPTAEEAMAEDELNG